MFNDEIILDENGLNKKITSHILSDAVMRDIGFSDLAESTWYYCKMVPFPKTGMYKDFEVSFNVQIPKNGDRLRIDVLDEDFCQPYDYQLMLKNSNHKTASIVRDFVEQQMEYLQSKGVLSGHVRGEYI